MQTEKLLVGSYVKINGDLTKIDDQLLEIINTEGVYDMEPLLIDVFILESLGFSQENGYYNYKFPDDQIVSVFIKGGKVTRMQFYWESYSPYFDEEIDFVHVLQFVCFERFGKMLTLKEN